MLTTTRTVLKRACTRTYATPGSSFIPPASLENVDRYSRPPPKQKPESGTFYTGRAAYFDQLITLETAVKHTRSTLTQLHLLPLPEFARASLPPLQPVWKDKFSLTNIFGGKLSTSRYRRVTALLNELNDFHRIAQTAGHTDIGGNLSQILELFERENKEAVLARGKRKPVRFDEFGRSYTIGRRKESSARVWMIAALPKSPSQSLPDASASTPISLVGEEINRLRLLPTANPKVERSLHSSVSPSEILVNSLPLSRYFSLPADRERVVRPLKVAGLLGAFNVFALVRGGGTSGQSGAVSLGIAKGLAAHVPDVEVILRKAKLMRRDPRMVERKKTGLAKARKRYAWVKR